MNTWLVYAVGFSQIIVLYWLALPTWLHMTYNLYIGKNRQWVNDNPAFQQLHPPPKYLVWLSYLLGAVLIAFYSYDFSSTKTDAWGVSFLTTPIIPCVALYIGHAIIEYFRIFKNIPLSTKRSVTLERRVLKDMVNPLWVYLGYFLLVVIAAVYSFALYDDQISNEVFIKRMIGTGGSILIISLYLLFSVRRKKNLFDEIRGPSYRKGEVAFSIACLYLFSMLGVLNVLQDIFNMQPPAKITVFLTTAVQISRLTSSTAHFPAEFRGCWTGVLRFQS